MRLAARHDALNPNPFASASYGTLPHWSTSRCWSDIAAGSEGRIYGAISVEMTPAAPRRFTASCQSAPSDPSPRTTAPLTSRFAKSAAVPAPTSTSVARTPPAGVGKELIASDTRSRSRDSSGGSEPSSNATVPIR